MPRRPMSRSVKFLCAIIVIYALIFIYNRTTPFTLGFFPLSPFVRKIVVHEAIKHKDSEEYCLKVLDEVALRSLLEPDFLPDDVPDGEESLPLIFRYPDKLSNPVYTVGDRLMDGKLIVRSLREFYASLRLSFAVDSLVSQASPRLVAWLGNRCNAKPAARLDTLIWLLLENSDLNKNPESFWHETRPIWRQMHLSSNPIYRLLALVNARSWAKDWEELLKVYAAGLEERESIFQSRSLWGIGGARVVNPARTENAPAIYAVPVPIEKAPLFLDLLQKYLANVPKEDATFGLGTSLRHKAQRALESLQDKVSQREG